MSHVIPIVSSSPPPFDDDDASLGWNDEDDDFGHFTGAPHIEPNTFHIGVDSSKSDVSLPGDDFVVNKAEMRNSLVNSQSHDSFSSAEDVPKDSLSITESYLDKSTLPVENCDDKLEDFAQFPNSCVDNLTTEIVLPHQENSECGDVHSVENDGHDSNENQFAEKSSAETDSSSVCINNESVYSNTSTIDSGVFSSDLSPSTHPTTALSQSSEYSENQGALGQSPEVRATTDVSSNESHNVLQGGFSASCDSEDWSDFNAAFDNVAKTVDSVDEETLKADREEHVLGIIPVHDESIPSTESVPSVTAVDSEEIKPTGLNESIASLQDADNIVPERGTVSSVSEVDTETNLKDDDGEWGDFDYKVSDAANEVNPEISSDLPNNSLQNLSGDKDIEGTSHDNLDLDNSITKTDTGLLSANDSQSTGGCTETDAEQCKDNKVTEIVEAVHLPEEGEDDEFGTFKAVFDKRDSDPHDEVEPVTFRTSVFETGEDSDDFVFSGQTGSNGAVFQDHEEEDDFGNFNAASHVEEPEPVEFGDFDSAARSMGGDNFIGNGNEDSKKPDDDNDWADFDEASPVQPIEPSGVTGSNFSRLNEANESKAQKLEKAVVNCFPEILDPAETVSQHRLEDSSGSHEHKTPSGTPEVACLTTLDTVVELGLSNPLEAKQQSWTVVQHPSKKDPKVRLWSNLKDVDSSHALQYTWSTSHCSKEVFITLHIDTQNVLFTQKKQAVPFFASGLSILEPIRGGADSKNNRHSISPTTLFDTSRFDQSQNVTSVQDIPPVDFDWSSSGLTNPLTANTLDLDFLVVQGGDSYEKTSVFKADCQESTRPSLQPLEDILKKSTPTAKLATYETLSPEALRILDRMPDLSFMHSRVLMFPVKQ